LTSQNKSVEKWPNFFIVGAPKAGTTSLHTFLNDIPGIYMSPMKEPHYFNKVDLVVHEKLLKPIRDKNHYLKLFENIKNEKVVGESSPTYLTEPESPLRIHEIAPQAHILISLRDPVERYYSQYFQYVRTKKLKLSFHEQLQMRIENKTEHPDRYYGLKLFKYSEKVKKYLDVFGPKQVKIIIFEEFIEAPKKTFQDILKFLDVNFSMEDFRAEIKNPFRLPKGPVSSYLYYSKTVKKIAKLIPSSQRSFLKEKVLLTKRTKPKMGKQDREFLIKFYKDDVKELQKILGRELPWSNFKN